ncbi:(5-formylfuran-3-yl)methyl phosphate synthase [Betaproteobacteria bacterium]|nr:(5-formylfuran-3-yl)methyl phosphate synthase [Betaproteobacteria bacterium]
MVDLKEPKNGPIGMLDSKDIRNIVLALRDNKFCGKISTTFELNQGNMPGPDIAKIEELVRLGLDYIKIGVSADGNTWATLRTFTENLSKIKNRLLDNKLILVLMITDKHSFKFVKNISPSMVRKFSGIMIDTLDKENGSVFDIVDFTELNIIKKLALEKNVDFGIAGSLDISHTKLINQLQPNWAGYRGGVCMGKRAGPLSRVRVENLIDSFC